MEKHIFVLWPRAIEAKNDVLSLLQSHFAEVRQIEINIPDELLIQKTCKIYDIDEDAARKRLAVSGFGTFVVFEITDTQPLYDTIWRFGTGYTKTNTKIYACKTQIREKLGHAFMAHSSNDTREALKDLRIILGPRFHIDGTLAPEDFSSSEEVFNFLNETDEYLVLRDYSPGDIDVLTRRTPAQMARLLEAKHQRLRFLTFKPPSKANPLDIVNVHHGIFCPVWSNNMLQARVYDEDSKRYRPHPEDLLFSLLYHYVLHKRAIPASSFGLIQNLIATLKFDKLANINLTDKKEAVYHLLKFMRKNNYSAPIPMDPKMYFDVAVHRYMMNDLGLAQLKYDPEAVAPAAAKTPSPASAGPSLPKLAAQLLTQAVSNKIVVDGDRKGNSLLRHGLIETIRLPINVKSNGEDRPYLLKLFYSPYEPVLAALQTSLQLSIKAAGPGLCVPRNCVRVGQVIYTLEPKLSGRNLSEALPDLRAQNRLADILSQLEAIKTQLIAANLNHKDIHAKNIVVDSANRLQLIDFKYAGPRDQQIINAITPLKSTSDTDDVAFARLTENIQIFAQSGKMPGLYNPKIDALIAAKFTERFKAPAKIASFKEPLKDCAALFLARVTDESEKPLDLNEQESFFFNLVADCVAELETLRAQA